jgi:putative endonuclease
MGSINYIVYILSCNNGALYTGYTSNLQRRYQEHIHGSASKFTRSFKPLYIAQYWQITGKKSMAMKIEKYIKGLSRQEKEKLILFPDNLKKIAADNMSLFSGITAHFCTLR